MKFVLFLIAQFTTYFAMAEEIRVDFLDTREAVIADYCRTEELGHYKDCSYNGNTRLVTLYVPESLGKILLSQMNEAWDNKYYDTIDKDDLFHTHFFLKGPSTHYSSPTDYFSDVTANLYHSAEYNERWWEEANAGIAVEERRVRSYMGWLDGHVQPATEIFPEDFAFTKNYVGSGTVYPNEVQKARPELSSHKILSNRYPDITLSVCKGSDCRQCEPDNQLLIVSEPTARFVTKHGARVEFYMRCYYPRH